MIKQKGTNKQYHREGRVAGGEFPIPDKDPGKILLMVAFNNFNTHKGPCNICVIYRYLIDICNPGVRGCSRRACKQTNELINE